LSQSFVATFLPVAGGFRLFSQHHGRAMGEEMHRCKGY
jgi:hypothetical protein